MVATQTLQGPQLTAVLDIECCDWDQFLIGALYTDGDIFVTRDPQELLFATLAVEGDVWAHNGGRYDWLWLTDVFSRVPGAQAQIVMSGSSATCITIGGTRLRDSYRLIPMSLDKASQITGERKGKLDEECVCNKACGGYCTLSPHMSDARWKRTEDYLRQDCVSLASVLDFIAEYALDNQIVLRGTVGATAWATMRKISGAPRAEWEPSVYSMVAPAYFGGRTECRRMSAPEIVCHDIHSAYPAALVATDLPVGAPKELARAAAGCAFDSGRPGTYTCRVRVPESMAPPLPWRGNNRLYFPSGEFDGTWALPELSHAVDCGVEILEFHFAHVWPTAEPILAGACQHVWDLRAREAVRNPMLARWLKWVANSATGKLGQDPNMRAYALDVTGDDLQACPGGECSGTCPRGRCCNHQCSGRCQRWDSDDPLSRIWSRPVYRMPGSGHVHWAAYLTAVTRVNLHRQILHAGDRWVYSDTDSVYATEELTNDIGNDLGQWAIEEHGRNWRCIAPKAYYYETNHGPVIRCKGLSRIGTQEWEDYCAGIPVDISSGVMGLKSAARLDGPLFRRRHMTRKAIGREGYCGGRRVGDNGVTHAVDVEELITKE